MKIKPIEMNKKGSLIDIIVWLVVSFVAVIFFALWIYGFDRVTTTLTNIEDTSGTFNVSISSASKQTFGQLNPIQKRGLHIISFAMIFFMGLSIIVSSFVIKSHPAFFIVYLFIVISAIILSAIISNEYESLMSDNVLGATLSEFTASSFIMLNLPLWTTVFGMFGAIFLFAGILRDSGAGGSVV